MDYQQFFDELRSRLDKAKDLVRELDRRLAYRFSVLDYLRHDELGLSRIIADLLDPKALHGQGTLFLKTLLGMEGLKHRRQWPEPGGSQPPVVVTRERRTSSARKIDITVQIGTSDKKSYCLAIENKPYDDDRPNQVKDYLDYLKGEYCDRFLLIYIPPTGQGPSEKSITKRELQKWKDEFAIMPYHEDPEGLADNFYDEYRIPHSVADWIEACRKNCEVDRLRWFLGDLKTFCQRKFGGHHMTTSPERDETTDFVLMNSCNLKIAQAVYESWPEVKKRVCERFLKELCSRINVAVKENEKLNQFTFDICIDYAFGDKAWETNVWLYRKCWTRYPVEPQHHGRTIIGLSNEHAGPDGIGFCVSSPMERSKLEGKFKDQRKCLDTNLESAFACGKNTDKCPWWWDKADPDKTNWSSRILDLHQETDNKGGEIMNYVVDRFTEIAVTAIPIINRIEGR